MARPKTQNNDKKNHGVKKRHWCFFVYPDSAPANWIDILQKKGLMFAISPLHDKDIHIAGVDDEREKKAHWHVIACWEGGTTTFSVVKAITDELNAPIPQALESVRGYYRYFTHKDNPDKYQYDEKEIQTFGGFNILNFFELTRNEIDAVKWNLQELIEIHDMLEYRSLMMYLQVNDMRKEHAIASSNTIFLDKYISSRRNQRKEQKAKEEYEKTKHHSCFEPEECFEKGLYNIDADI
jgi:hypothetical protein